MFHQQFCKKSIIGKFGFKQTWPWKTEGMTFQDRWCIHDNSTTYMYCTGTQPTAPSWSSMRVWRGSSSEPSPKTGTASNPSQNVFKTFYNKNWVRSGGDVNKPDTLCKWCSMNMSGYSYPEIKCTYVNYICHFARLEGL